MVLSRRVQHGHRALVAERAEAQDARLGDRVVVQRPDEQPLEDVDQRRHRFGGPQRGEQPHGIQGVGGAQFVGGQGRRRLGRTWVAQLLQRLCRAGAAGGIAVVQHEHQRLEGPAVPRAAQREGRDLAGPQRPFGLHEHGSELVARLRPALPGQRDQARVLDGLGLWPHSVDQRSECVAHSASPHVLCATALEVLLPLAF